MDERIRQLERQAAAGDQAAAARLEKLRCRHEGCTVYVVEDVLTSYVPEKMATAVIVKVVGGKTIRDYLPDHMLLGNRYHEMSRIFKEMANALARCPRCGRKNDRMRDFLYTIQRGLAKHFQ